MFAAPVGPVGTWGKTGHGRANDGEPGEVEGDGAQRPRRGVDQMAASAIAALRRAQPARHVARVAAAPNQDGLRAGPEIEDRDLRLVEATGRGGDREQHRLAARQRSPARDGRLRRLPGSDASARSARLPRRRSAAGPSSRFGWRR